jgi:branched-chain amino acid transport system permease protein
MHQVLTRRSVPLYSIAIGAALLSVPFLMSITYVLNVLILFFIYATTAVCWDLVGGHLGQINLGQASFFGIGGYATALLFLTGFSPFVGMMTGGFLAALFAILFLPLFRLKGNYFAMASLGLAEALRIAMLNWDRVTGGVQGLYMPVPGNYSIVPYYYLSLFILVSTILGKKLYLQSNIGLAVIAIRDEEDAAEALGVNVFKYKLLTFMVSALFVGLAGGFYAYYLSYVEPNNLFGILWSLIPLFMVVLGGVRSDAGPIVGAAFYIAIPEVLLIIGFTSEMGTIIFGSVLIAVIILRSRGVGRILRRGLYASSHGLT